MSWRTRKHGSPRQVGKPYKVQSGSVKGASKSKHYKATPRDRLTVNGEVFKDKQRRVTDGYNNYRAKITFWPWGNEVQARLTLEQIGERGKPNNSYPDVEQWTSEVLDDTGHFFEASVERDVFNHSSECGQGECELLKRVE